MSASQLLQTAYDLERAAEIVEEGWCQSAFEFKGKHCVLGAILIASDNRRAVRGALCGHLGISGSLSVWNDAPNRTRAEVVCACLDCAAKLRRRAEHG